MLWPFPLQVSIALDDVVELSFTFRFGPDPTLDVALHDLHRMSTCASEPSIRESHVDCRGSIDMACKSLASIRQAIRILHIEDPVPQIAFDQRINPLWRLYIVVVRLTKRWHNISPAQIHRRADAGRLM